MINNSSKHKWERLQQKELDGQFVNAIIRGMNCSEFEAKGILNTVYEVYKPFFDESASLLPGQMLFEAVSIENGPKEKLSECNMITLTLTVDAGSGDLKIRETEGVIGLRLHRLQRICNEAFQQGGLLTVEDIANRLLNCGERTVCRDIKTLKDKGIVLPMRSTIKDMGRTLTHRVIIVKEWLLGKEYSSIARKTNHSIESVKNYIDKFKRVICLAKENYEFHTIAFLVKLSKPLVEEYYNLHQTFDIAPHRQEEIENLTKKNCHT